MLSRVELVRYIENSKNVVFKNNDERERMIEFLEKYNYSNIFSLKYLFSSGRSTKKIDGVNKNYFIYNSKTEYGILEVHCIIKCNKQI